MHMVPQQLVLDLPFDDNSGNKLSLKFEKGERDVKIYDFGKDGSEFIIVRKEDLKWLRQAIDDVIDLVEFERYSQPEKTRRQSRRE